MDLPSLGITHFVIGLQYNHFWKNYELGVDFPRERGERGGGEGGGRGGGGGGGGGKKEEGTKENTFVAILKRDNYIARELGGSGTVDVGFGTHISMNVLKDLPKRVERHQEKFRKMYCGLKEAGVPVLLITYEEMVRDISKIMSLLLEFIGVEEDLNSKFFQKIEKKFTSKHTPLSQRATNYQEAYDFLEQNHPQYLCMLREDCIYPSGFTCPTSSNSSISSLWIPSSPL